MTASSGDRRARREELEHLRTLSVPEAGRLLGLARNGAYEAAKRGEIPVLKFGKKLRVPLLALEEMIRGCKGRSL